MKSLLVGVVVCCLVGLLLATMVPKGSQTLLSVPLVGRHLYAAGLFMQARFYRTEINDVAGFMHGFSISDAEPSGPSVATAAIPFLTYAFQVLRRRRQQAVTDS